MDLKKLFVLQKDLDSTIYNQDILLDNSLLPKKVLALQVKLGQLADATNCSKFGNFEINKNTDLILEKYVDCLCFLLSMGTNENLDSLQISSLGTNYTITEQFLELYIDVNDFFTCNCPDNYLTLIEDFLNLGFSLGFTEESIFNTYFKLSSSDLDKRKVFV